MPAELNVFDPSTPRDDGPGGEVVMIAGEWYRVRVRPLEDHESGRLPAGPVWMRIDGHCVGLERIEFRTSSSGDAAPAPSPRLAGS